MTPRRIKTTLADLEGVLNRMSEADKKFVQECQQKLEDREHFEYEDTDRLRELWESHY